MTDFHHGRHAGVLLPLSAMPSSRSWGIGEIRDLVPAARWLGSAGFDFLLLLPVNEMSGGQHSPYSAITAMGIDPIYISVWAVDEYRTAGGQRALDPSDRRRLAHARASRAVEFDVVRDVKMRALSMAYERFVEQEWNRDTPRAQAFRDYVDAQSWWLPDYALFRAARDARSLQPWWTWEGELAARSETALDATRRTLAAEIRLYEYLQWIADQQWRAASRAARPVGIFGDLPFMVGRDSADVWVRQHAFDHEATIGTPPDAFSETGQDWGLPVYRWDAIAADGDAWIHERARRSADLFAGFRIDHVVGFYRTYCIPEDGGERTFSPPDEPSQLAQGERLVRAFAAPGARVVAEDLGTVPDFVRESLARLEVPGYKVLRWERDWEVDGQPFHDPRAYPRLAVATTGTHDTETLAAWWAGAQLPEREAVAAVAGPQASSLCADGFDDRTRDALVELMYASSADFVLFPFQDLFGWRDRINTPATLSEENWTWRLPWPVDRLADLPEAQERAAALRRWAAGRT
jgi:4-alpha-glucanotransferase